MPASCATWAFAPTAWCASTRPPAWPIGPRAITTPTASEIADTFSEACTIAEDFGERLAAEGEICWGGMHSWQRMLQLLEMVGRPQTLGFQADMAHTLLYVLGHNAPEDAILPADFDWKDTDKLDAALRQLTAALRPWTIDFHVAQNDATVHGTGSHDKTGRHCLPDDPNGKLDIVKVAGYWLRDDDEHLTKKFQHICWDGCMFPNEVMMDPGDLEYHPGHHDRRARGARLARVANALVDPFGEVHHGMQASPFAARSYCSDGIASDCRARAEARRSIRAAKPTTTPTGRP